MRAAAQESACIARVSGQRLHFIEKEALNVSKNEKTKEPGQLGYEALQRFLPLWHPGPEAHWGVFSDLLIEKEEDLW